MRVDAARLTETWARRPPFRQPWPAALPSEAAIDLERRAVTWKLQRVSLRMKSSSAQRTIQSAPKSSSTPGNAAPRNLCTDL
jgi:hypothetical protein